MRIALTDYSSLDEVLAAVRDLPYEGGASRTGDALQYLIDYVFSPAITRDHTPKVVTHAHITHTHAHTHTHTHTHT